MAIPQDMTPRQQADIDASRYLSEMKREALQAIAPKGWKAGQPLWLNLGDLREVAQVAVNGKDVGTAWHAPYRLDVSGAVKAGKNHIEVRVANLWINRLIGDAQKGAQKVAFTTMPTYRADAPLRASGLIGPVVLEAVGK